MTKKRRNLLFLLSILIFLISIIFINYQVDPHRVFHKDDYMDMASVEPENILIKMKAYKNVPYDTVIIGASETGKMFENSAMTKKYFNRIYGYQGLLNQRNYYRLLKSYIDLHPETKKVIIFVNYSSLISSITLDFPEYTGPKYNLDELVYLLLGKNTIGLSLDELNNSIMEKLEENPLSARMFKKNEEYERILQVVHPYQADDFVSAKEDAVQILEDNIKYYNQIFDFLDSKNIKYTLVLPPYNASFLALINKDKVYKHSLESFLRYLITKSSDIYDFALVNKYTLQDIFSNDNYLYYNYNHPNFIFGSKVLKVLYNKPEAEKDIYIKLSNKNIDSVIKKQDKLLNEYIKYNYKAYSEIKKIAYGEVEGTENKKIIKYKNIPPDGIKELEYIDREITEMENDT